MLPSDPVRQRPDEESPALDRLSKIVCEKAVWIIASAVFALWRLATSGNAARRRRVLTLVRGRWANRCTSRAFTAWGAMVLEARRLRQVLTRALI